MKPVLPQCPETEDKEFPADCWEWFAEPTRHAPLVDLIVV
jgi:hypothetical protein